MRSISVLVLEDHPLQRAMTSAVVESCGVGEVLEAEDGEEAIRLMVGREVPVDVVLCDLMMDGMDGIEFVRHLGEKSLGAAVVLASGLDEELVRSVEAMARVRGVTVLGRLPKPPSRQDLLALLEGYRLERRGKAERRFHSLPQRSILEIQSALAAGEFVAWYQPKVRMADDVVVGVEALVRWQHPQDGLLSPAVFIPTVESSPLIGPFTEHILALSSRFAARQAEKGRFFTVSFNLSAASLHDLKIPSRYRQVVQSGGVQPERLVAEITETVVEDNLAQAMEVLTRLRMYGFGLSIDDFGTGYSSLQKLGRLPFTELKIDRSFVQDVHRSPKGQAILRSIIGMSKEVGLKTVAEGVERQEEWDVLRTLGCDVVQGYFVARPMPDAEFERWISERKS